MGGLLRLNLSGLGALLHGCAPIAQLGIHHGKGIEHCGEAKSMRAAVVAQNRETSLKSLPGICILPRPAERDADLIQPIRERYFSQG